MNARQLAQEMANSVRDLKHVAMPSDTFPLFGRYVKATQEHFMIVTLNGHHDVIKLHVITKGLVNRTLIHPREVFLCAIKDNATSIILAHNHPSGALDASPEDIDITNKMQAAGSIIGIDVLDHLIISKRGFMSMLETGIMRPADTL